MLLYRKKKIQKFQGGGSVGFASDYKVKIGSPEKRGYSAANALNLLNKYQKPTKYKVPKTKTPKRRELEYGNLKDMTDGLRAMFKNNINKRISDISSLDPASPLYADQLQNLQLQTTDEQADAYRDFKNYQTAVKASQKNKSGFDYAVYGGNVFFATKDKKGNQDVIAVPIYDAMSVKNQRPLKVQELISIKNVASKINGKPHFQSALLNNAINGRYGINNVISNLSGNENLYKFIGNQARTSGNIKTSTKGNLVIGTEEINPELLKAIWQDGKIPSGKGYNLNSTNITALNSALGQVKDALVNNPSLNDSMDSLALKRVINNNPNLDTTTDEGKLTLRDKLDEEKNKIIVEQLAKNLKIKLGVPKDEDDKATKKSFGLDVSLKGDVAETPQTAAFTMAGTEGFPKKYIKMGELKVDTDKPSSALDGQIIATTDAQLGTAIMEEIEKDRNDKKDDDIVTISLAKSKTIEQYMDKDKLFLPDGEEIKDPRVLKNIYINPDEQIKAIPSILTRNGKPAVNETALFEEYMKDPKTKQYVQKRLNEIMKTKGKLSPEDNAEILNEIFEQAVKKEGYNLNGLRIEMMYLVPIEFSDETLGGKSVTASKLIQSPFTVVEDNSSLNNMPGADSGWEFDEFYKGWVMMKAKPITMQRAYAGNLRIPKTQAGYQSAAQELKITDHKAKLAEIADIDLIKNLFKTK